MRLHALALLLALEGVAAAQRSGGHIGGGGWSSGARSSGTSSTGIAIPSDGPQGGASGPDSWPGLLVLAAAGALVVAIVRTKPPARSRPPTWARKDVRVATIRVVVDATQREHLLPALRDLAHRTDTTTPLGRAELVHEVALLLRRAAAGWLYASTDVTEELRKSDARYELATRVGTERARFDVDRIVNHDGVVTEPVVDDGSAVSGLAVVTILLATKGYGLDDTTAIDRDSLHDALAWLGNLLPENLIAADVVWSPADRDESLDSIAVEARFGDDLTRLANTTAGTIVCAHCSSRYSAEAGRCSTCGSRYLGKAVA